MTELERLGDRMANIENAIERITVCTQSIAENVKVIAVLEERHAETSRAIERAFQVMKEIEVRVRVVEVELPGLKEIRQWVMTGVLTTVGFVGAAVVALVVNR